MAVVGTNFPDRVALNHTYNQGTANWLVEIENFSLSLTLDEADPIYTDDTVYIQIEVDGNRETVGDMYTEGMFFESWVWDDDEEGTFNLGGRRDDDSSRLVANHDGTNYDGLRPGEGEWIIELQEFSDSQIVAREPVTVYPTWINPGDLKIQNCSTSETRLRPGETATLSTTINNEGYDPLAGDAVAFVGDTETEIPFEVAPRGETTVEATFEMETIGTLDYGFDLRDVAHNY